MNPAGIRHRVALAALSGLAVAAAFPPLDLGPVAWVALVPLAFALRGASARAGALAGLVFAVASLGVVIYWISYFGWLAWTVLTLAQAAFVAAACAGAAVWSRRGLVPRLLALPVLFTAAEIARERWPLGGFAWGGLGYTQHDGGTMLGIARVGGVHLLTFGLVLLNVVIAEALASRAGRRRVMGAVAVAIVAAPGLVGLGVASAGEYDVAVIQGNVPRERFTGLGRNGREGPEDLVIIDNHVRVTERLLGTPTPDLVVWPENSFDRDPRQPRFIGPAGEGPIGDLIRRVGAPFVIGSILTEGTRWTNSSVLVGSDGVIAGRYDKVHLVPFGEYVPWDWARRIVPALDRELPVSGIAGQSLDPLRTADGVSIGSLICFESTYPALARDLVADGANLIVVTTNNASFGTSPAARQHLAMSRMRAIETGRAVVHAAVSGISAVVMPDGEVVERTGLFEQALVRRSVPLSERRTLAVRAGAWIEALLLAAGASLVAVAIALRGRKEGASG